MQMTFGAGELAIDTGTIDGKPAVFVKRVAVPGIVGNRLPDDLQGPLDRLEDGEIVMTFQTEKQARAVADALVGMPPHPKQ